MSKKRQLTTAAGIPVGVAFYLFVQSLGGHTVKFSQIAVEHDPLPSNEHDVTLDLSHR